jgi:nucleoside-diphosphate kinase
MKCLTTQRTFLKRTPLSQSPGTAANLKVTDFTIGSSVDLFGRVLTIKEYADAATSQRLNKVAGGSVSFLLLASCSRQWGRVLADCEKSGATITGARTFVPGQVRGKDERLDAWCDCVASRDDFEGPCLAVQFRSPAGDDGRLLEFALSSGAAAAPDGGRAGWDLGDGSSFFTASARKVPPTATMNSSSLLLVKPHVIRSGVAGGVLSHLLGEGYELSAVQSYTLDLATAREFLAPYQFLRVNTSVLEAANPYSKRPYPEAVAGEGPSPNSSVNPYMKGGSGVEKHSPEFEELCQSVLGGVLLAVEVRAEDAVRSLRASCGPWDVEMARALRPKSIRGIYGEASEPNTGGGAQVSLTGHTKKKPAGEEEEKKNGSSGGMRNAVYCTDLEESAEDDVRYFFDVLLN